MEDEHEALLANNTWTLSRQTSMKNLIHTKCVCKVKQKEDGSVDRQKARLVTKVFEQVNGLDFIETFSPMIKLATMRVVLALAIQFDWEIRQLDISNAFLLRILNEDVYIELP